MSSVGTAAVASQTGAATFKNRLCTNPLRKRRKQPAANPPAAISNSVPGNAFPGAFSMQVNDKRLLELDGCAGFFKLLLEVLGLVLRRTFLDG